MDAASSFTGSPSPSIKKRFESLRRSMSRGPRGLTDATGGSAASQSPSKAGGKDSLFLRSMLSSESMAALTSDDESDHEQEELATGTTTIAAAAAAGKAIVAAKTKGGEEQLMEELGHSHDDGTGADQQQLRGRRTDSALSRRFMVNTKPSKQSLKEGSATATTTTTTTKEFVQPTTKRKRGSIGFMVLAIIVVVYAGYELTQLAGVEIPGVANIANSIRSIPLPTVTIPTFSLGLDGKPPFWSTWKF